MSDDFKRVGSHDRPMSIRAGPAGSPCRIGKDEVAIQYRIVRRASTARQSLDAQQDSLTEAGATHVFSERISTRVTTRRACATPPRGSSSPRARRKTGPSPATVVRMLREHDEQAATTAAT
ncbi:hypothetical protein ABZ023_26840 [Streptomyces sp. NPDC006367]|uniref:hypothetical protein n=1 Tax=unclassified Streptomyces TaxID=2593676 RepID=UPI0033B78352